MAKRTYGLNICKFPVKTMWSDIFLKKSDWDVCSCKHPCIGGKRWWLGYYQVINSNCMCRYPSKKVWGLSSGSYKHTYNVEFCCGLSVSMLSIETSWSATYLEKYGADSPVDVNTHILLERVHGLSVPTLQPHNQLLYWTYFGLALWQVQISTQSVYVPAVWLFQNYEFSTINPFTQTQNRASRQCRNTTQIGHEAS